MKSRARCVLFARQATVVRSLSADTPEDLRRQNEVAATQTQLSDRATPSKDMYISTTIRSHRGGGRIGSLTVLLQTFLQNTPPQCRTC
jgi:hypothetical protein